MHFLHGQNIGHEKGMKMHVNYVLIICTYYTYIFMPFSCQILCPCTKCILVYISNVIPVPFTPLPQPSPQPSTSTLNPNLYPHPQPLYVTSHCSTCGYNLFHIPPKGKTINFVNYHVPFRYMVAHEIYGYPLEGICFKFYRQLLCFIGKEYSQRIFLLCARCRCRGVTITATRHR